MTTASNSENLQKGNEFRKKLGVAEVEWRANGITEEEEISTAVELWKTRFNARKEHGLRLLYSAPWNSMPVQAKFNALENNSEGKEDSLQNKINHLLKWA